MNFRDLILKNLEAPLDGVALCHACGVEEAEPDAEKAEAFGDALEGLETEGMIHWGDGLWHVSEDRRVPEQRVTRAVLEHFLATGKSSTREDIASVCGVSVSTVGKWLKMCGGLPRGCSYELRARRGGGGGAAKEHYYPRIHVLREEILRDRAGRE